jgi:hypothetical protein
MGNRPATEDAGTGAGEDAVALDLLLRGFQVSRMLRLVADLGVADRIPPDAGVEIEDLAGACGVQAQPLKRVLRALSTFEIFRIAPEGRVTHTARSRLLRTDTPGSRHHSAKFWTAPGSWGAWGMLDAAMTGGVPHQAAWNTGRFDYLRAHPAEARDFDTMMATFPDNRHAAIADAYDFSKASLVADIGGGNGAALRQILARHPHARGLLIEREDVVRALGPDELMDGRIDAAAGSFFDGVPPGADVYLLVRVLHDWSDDDCLRILRRCREAIRDDAVLLVCDQVLDPDPSRASPAGYLVDTQMMAMFGSARERTEGEFVELLQACGLALRRIVATPSAVQVLEVAPIPLQPVSPTFTDQGAAG